MLPTVFLSLSGVDVNFVANVERNIPPGMAYFYPKSFENGENLISAMEERVADSRIFVLFASRASVDSVWVHFEIERARINKIQHPGFRYFVFPVEPGVDRAKLPAWMREAWIPSAGHTAKDIARYLRGVLASMAELSGTILPPSDAAALSTRHAVSIRMLRSLTRSLLACSCSPATPALAAERSNAS
ncbi:toll/interleukin-1 receptor domain-containing protein [Agrobacterium salinitolerans]|uniref:Toll/interleukin-1 receptor domain-containing protein n=1 Tax=Agrobacterium salinitolerans TaxID=1183413 RepID=A0ABY3BSZ5_9HYPH|nr:MULTISPECIES: toll/interleukin-1 receptor domain-containing protein [Agrobacterium]MCZ7891900.1 toll/interleukin-1 receptor domain-containing protein [Agrobacterium salinitolerans]TRA94048.1 toll/interleukin-1 receptor domain-containing protein [Agrobacterium salinitolerans]